jgi:Mg/Co/Ni transporter MgtE
VVRSALKVRAAQQDLKERLDQMDQMDPMDPMEQLAQQARVVLLVLLGHKVQQVRAELQVRAEQRA